MEQTTISFKVGGAIRDHLRKQKNISAYLRNLIEAEMDGNSVAGCPICDYLRRWGRGRAKAGSTNGERS